MQSPENGNASFVFSFKQLDQLIFEMLLKETKTVHTQTL